jgi:fibronectin type 3 domain-containing protein
LPIRARAILIGVPAVVSVALAILVVLAVVGRGASHSVTLNWRPPMPVKGVTVVSYDVYRSVTPGGPYVRIASGVTGLTYHDSIVNNTKTYYYAVTSVDAVGHESAYSTEAQAKIP